MRLLQGLAICLPAPAPAVPPPPPLPATTINSIDDNEASVL